MGRVTLGGMVSGLDTDDIIQKLMDLETNKIKAQESKKKALQAKQSAWTEIKTSLTTLRSKTDTIRLSSTFRARTTTLSDSDVASVSVSSGATVGTHTLSVSKLAQTHSIAGGSTATSADTALGVAGTFTIDVDGTTETITMTALDTLNSLRDTIKAQAGSLVTAEVVKTQDPATLTDRYRLVLTSKSSGADGEIVLAADAGSPNILEAANLGFHSVGVVANEITAAQDSEFTLDGMAYQMSTNVISDVIPMVSITLKKADTVTPESTDITVAQNSDSVSTGVEAWVSALNATLDLLKAKTGLDATGKQGVLASEPLARQLYSTLRSQLSNVVGGLATDFNSLNDVGITTGAYGTTDFGRVLVNTTTFKAKVLESEDSMAMLFGAIRTNLALNSTNPAAVPVASSYDTVDPTTDYSPGGAFNDIVDNARFGTPGGGWMSAAVPSAGSPEYLAINLGSNKWVDQVRLFLPEDVTTSGLKDFTVEYSTDSTDGLTDGSWTTAGTVTDNVSTFKTLDFDSSQAKWVRLKVTGTYGAAEAAKVLEMQVHETTAAPGLAVYKYVNNSLTSSTGTVATRTSSLTTLITDIDSRMNRMLDSLEATEKRLRQQFTRMETSLRRLQAQGNSLFTQFFGNTGSQG